MSNWEQKIIDACIGHYTEDRQTLRLRSASFFPDFDTANPDEKESYLEAAESLERKGIVKLRWEKCGKGERLKTLSCENFEKLFAEAGRPHPQTEAEKIRTMLCEKLQSLKDNLPVTRNETAGKIISFLEFLSLHFGPREISLGLNHKTMEDFIRLLEFSLEPAKLEKITTRALSILLYRDSKRLENLLALCKPLLSHSQKHISAPDLAIPERSYPETMIAGKIIIEYKNQDVPMLNAGGHILILPLETAEAIQAIQTIAEKKEKTVLTVENKETFYALGSPHKISDSEAFSRYDCFLYTGGYSNRAASALIKVIASSGFSFYHAGDLDPDGILILQNIQDIAEKPVIPVRMDAVTFDQYRAWGRTLTKPMLQQIKKIREETKTISGLAGLLQRIEEIGLGVEQEIIDYR
ncbi:MAG: DUF2220 domain-containing protein [Treponema sp.]|jgi:hypothetical protein|nr:DUF2220 domain-containing protein [Treponema sp.]